MNPTVRLGCLRQQTRFPGHWCVLWGAPAGWSLIIQHGLSPEDAAHWPEPHWASADTSDDEPMGALTPHHGTPESQATRKIRLCLVTWTTKKPPGTGLAAGSLHQETEEAAVTQLLWRLESRARARSRLWVPRFLTGDKAVWIQPSGHP